MSGAEIRPPLRAAIDAAVDVSRAFRETRDLELILLGCLDRLVDESMLVQSERDRAQMDRADGLGWLIAIGEAVGCRGDEAAILQRVREVAASHAELVRTLNATIPVLYRADNPAAARPWSEQLMRALNRAQLMRALKRAERVERRP